MNFEPETYMTTDDSSGLIIVAVDGYSSSGKSTMAKALARNVGYRYIDSGAMYRAVTLYALRNNMISPDGSVDTTSVAADLDQIRIDFHTLPPTDSTLR